MNKEFTQIEWDEQVEDDCRHVIRLAVREDLDRTFDWTTLALVPELSQGRAAVVVRCDGVIAGLRAAELVLAEMDIAADWRPAVNDGDRVSAGAVVAEVSCKARDLLTAERLILNFIGRLSGIATLTRQYVDAVAATSARIYDTRKTTPGWRRLEKYAVRCGGGRNHRTGLFDAVLIKDNHLALAERTQNDRQNTPRDAVIAARQFLQEMAARYSASGDMIVEVEVDTLDQLRDVLPVGPDIVLLDNMSREQLREAVAIRDEANRSVQLEASGGIMLETVRAIAECCVDRISVGALTHSAISVDVGLDWLD